MKAPGKTQTADPFHYQALAKFGVGLYPGIEICPSAETWEVWNEVLISDRIRAALQDPTLGEVVKTLRQLPDPHRAFSRYAQLIAPLRGHPHASACAVDQVRTDFAREAYFRAWPDACRKCNGWGGWAVPPTSASPPDFDSCGACTDQGVCPRCGARACDDGVCPSCKWNADDGAPPEFDGCYCGYPTEGEC